MSLSGAAWYDEYPTSSSVSDLTPAFAANVRSFLDALAAAEAHVSIAATRRPPQRAYMMHYAWSIVNGKISPDKVPAYKSTKDFPGEVDIQWVHPDAQGKMDLAASKRGAQEMVDKFQIGHLKVAPALKSMHIIGEAIDMNISWEDDLVINNVLGKEVTIKTKPRDGTNAELIHVGAGYRVIHLLAVNKDKPHWSTNGY